MFANPDSVTALLRASAIAWGTGNGEALLKARGITENLLAKEEEGRQAWLERLQL